MLPEHIGKNKLKSFQEIANGIIANKIKYVSDVLKYHILIFWRHML
jgi:hypothetical protein